jgi:hypothetical protein
MLIIWEASPIIRPGTVACCDRIDFPIKEAALFLKGQDRLTILLILGGVSNAEFSPFLSGSILWHRQFLGKRP